MILNKLLMLLIFTLIVKKNLSKCLFSRKCGEFESSLGGVFPIPCVYNEEPQPLKNETITELLKSITPELFNATTPVFCCDEQQIIDMIEQLSIVHGFVQNCPSCFVNFAKIFFHMTCAPNQADFLDITTFSNSSYNPGKYQLDRFTYYASENFADSVYNSCKNVHLPSANIKAMAFLCGQWGEQNCTAQRFLSYIGTKDPSPIQIDFVFTKESVIHKTNNTGFYPLNPKTVSCADAPPGYSNKTCSCSDCPCK